MEYGDLGSGEPALPLAVSNVHVGLGGTMSPQLAVIPKNRHIRALARVPLEFEFEFCVSGLGGMCGTPRSGHVAVVTKS